MATRDVSSYAFVSPESFPVESTRVLISGQHSVNCRSLSDTAWSCAVVVAQCSVYCAGIVQHIRCLLFSSFLVTVHLVHETVCS